MQARLDRVVIGAMNAKAGCAGSIINLLDMQQFNHQIPITKGVLEQECSQILSEFFKRIRVKKEETPLDKRRNIRYNYGCAAGAVAVPCTFNPL